MLYQQHWRQEYNSDTKETSLSIKIEDHHKPHLNRWQRRFASSETRSRKGGHLLFRHTRKTRDAHHFRLFRRHSHVSQYDMNRSWLTSFNERSSKWGLSNILLSLNSKWLIGSTQLSIQSGENRCGLLCWGIQWNGNHSSFLEQEFVRDFIDKHEVRKSELIACFT